MQNRTKSILRFRSVKFSAHLLTTLGIILAMVLSTPTTSLAQSIQESIKTEVEKILRYEVYVDEDETPGFILGIVEVDTLFVVAFGKSASQATDIDTGAYYELGGLSKVYLAFLYQELTKKDLISNDTELRAIFSELVDSEWGSVTLNQLLTHQSGIPRMLKDVNTAQDDPLENLQLSDVIQGLQAIRRKKKKAFLYSHYNYALLAVALEKLTGKSIEQLWTSCYRCTEMRESLDLPGDSIPIALGLDKLGDIAKVKEYGIMKYSMGLQATVQELVKLVQSIRLLDESPLNITSELIKTDIDKTVKFSRGLYVLTGDKKYTVYSHSGRTERHSAAIHYVPQTQTGVVIVSNSEIGTKDLSLQVLRMVNGNWQRK